MDVEASAVADATAKDALQDTVSGDPVTMTQLFAGEEAPSEEEATTVTAEEAATWEEEANNSAHQR